MIIDTNTIYRYARPYSSSQNQIDGYKNFFYYTKTKGLNKALLDRGINPIGDRLPDKRIPAILINTNPLKSGSKDTPWMDLIDSDNGFVRYAGDNKPGSSNPDTPYNLKLIQQFEFHQSSKIEDRKLSSPIILFKNVQVGSARKGYKKFLGFGIVSKVERIIEFDRRSNSYYPNYVFDFMILDMSNENDTFDWDWISDRRNSEIQLKQTLKSAPSSWKKWIQGGAQLSLGLQRKIYKPLIVPATQQRKIDKSKKALLEKIYHYYDNNKHSFEFLAAYITERIIALDGSNYRLGWITSKASDGGIDFVGKIAIGKNISSVDIVVLGQAKCIKPKSSVSPIYLARTVSRLKRGWIGSFVTTGVFSDQAQKEVYNDKYPLMLINGSLVADIVASSLHIEKISNVEKFLQQIDNVYSDKVMNRRAEEAVYI
tara:strand:- start:110 stop:1390 length:1281 start_codon:yes stop_codon:yes gene_type:complete